MTDVVEIANERRARLSAEIAKLDEFIRMAEMLGQLDGPSYVARMALDTPATTRVGVSPTLGNKTKPAARLPQSRLPSSPWLQAADDSRSHAVYWDGA